MCGCAPAVTNPQFHSFGWRPMGVQRQLQRAETAALDDRIVFFSDVWVDHAATMAKLRQALGGYEEQEVVPTLFVLCGNFSAKILSVYAHLRYRGGEAPHKLARCWCRPCVTNRQEQKAVLLLIVIPFDIIIILIQV